MSRVVRVMGEAGGTQLLVALVSLVLVVAWRGGVSDVFVTFLTFAVGSDVTFALSLETAFYVACGRTFDPSCTLREHGVSPSVFLAKTIAKISDSVSEALEDRREQV